MKVLQITAAYKPAYIYGGPTMSVAKLCETLVKYNSASQIGKEQSAKNKEEFELEVFTTTANGKSELNVKPNKTSIVDGVKVTYFKRLTKDHTHFSPILLLSLRRIILAQIIKRKSEALKHVELKSNNNLIIHIHAWWNLVSILSCLIAKWYNIPVILTPRGMLTSYSMTNRNSISKEIIHKFLGRNLLRYCHIHVTSEKEKHDVLTITTPKSITVIHNLVELGNNKEPIFSNHLLDQNEKKTLKLIFLSRIEEKKGIELLFEALSSISFDWILNIAGSGDGKYIASLKTKAQKLKINDRINWIGQINNEDKFIFLAKHDLMVLTSYNENFANVVVESLSVGTPALLSSEVGLADYVEDKKLGWITDLTSENIKYNLINAHESVNLRMLIRQTAREIINKDFDTVNLIQKYFTLYSQIN